MDSRNCAQILDQVTRGQRKSKGFSLSLGNLWLKKTELFSQFWVLLPTLLSVGRLQLPAQDCLEFLVHKRKKGLGGDERRARARRNWEGRGQAGGKKDQLISAFVSVNVSLYFCFQTKAESFSCSSPVCTLVLTSSTRSSSYWISAKLKCVNSVLVWWHHDLRQLRFAAFCLLWGVIK